VGICLLLFHILPRVDLIRGCLLINSFGFLPLLCKTFLSPTLSDKHISKSKLWFGNNESFLGIKTGDSELSSLV